MADCAGIRQRLDQAVAARAEIVGELQDPAVPPGERARLRADLKQLGPVVTRLQKELDDCLHPPGPPLISDGSLVTDTDIATFDDNWLGGFVTTGLNDAHWRLYQRFDGASWEIVSTMAAMARMYKVTAHTRYLDKLREFCGQVMSFRDDHHPGPIHPEVPIPPQPVDEFRGRVVPGWGGKSVNSGGLHRVDEVVSSIYAHELAHFARIVVESPDLHGHYGADALRYTDALLETAAAFTPQVGTRTVGTHVEAYLTHLDIERTLPTPEQCRVAHGQAVEQEKTAGGRARLDQMLTNCLRSHGFAGRPMAHNENLAFAMFLIELWRALDSDLHRQTTSGRSAVVNGLRTAIPLYVSRLHRYFVDHLRTVASNEGGRFVWNYADDGDPDLDPHPEDPSHGNLDMRYLEVLCGAYDRLKVYPESVGEPLAVDPTLLVRFANTFLQKVAADSILADVAGNPRVRIDNTETDGWMCLAMADPLVYHRCREIALHRVNGEYPNLTAANHAALLWNKRYAP